MLKSQALAQKLHEALGQKTDGQGKPTPISDETNAYAAGVIECLLAGTFSHATGTVNGTTAPGSPLTLGTAVGGILVLNPALMVAKTTAKFEGIAKANIAKENQAVITYIMTGLINFDMGMITGQCTNTPLALGPLTLGAGNNGKIIGLTGSACFGAVLGVMGTLGPDALKHYSALIDYINLELQASYTPGSVVGVCPLGGGPLTLGAGAGGKIS